MENSTKFILCCLGATFLTFTTIVVGVVSYPLIGGVAAVVLACGAVLTTSSSQRIVVGTIGAFAVIMAGAVVPLGLEEVAMRWNLSEGLFVSLLLAGSVATLGVSLEAIRRRMTDVESIQ